MLETWTPLPSNLESCNVKAQPIASALVANSPETRLSDLPEEILGQVLGLLPFTDQVRTLPFVCNSFRRSLLGQKTVCLRNCILSADFGDSKGAKDAVEKRQSLSLWFEQRAPFIEQLTVAFSSAKDKRISVLTKTHWGGILPKLQNLQWLELANVHPDLLCVISHCTKLKAVSLTLASPPSPLARGTAVGHLTALTNLQALEIRSVQILGPCTTTAVPQASSATHDPDWKGPWMVRSKGPSHCPTNEYTEPKWALPVQLIHRLTSLTRLALANCTIPHAVTALQSLEHLGVLGLHGKLEQVRDILALSKLTSLEMGSSWEVNKVNDSLQPGEVAACLPQLRALTVVYGIDKLEYNRDDEASGFQFDCFSALTSLTSLCYGGRRGVKPFTSFSSLRKLRDLTVVGSFDGAVGSAITSLEALTRLTFKIAVDPVPGWTPICMLWLPKEVICAPSLQVCVPRLGKVIIPLVGEFKPGRLAPDVHVTYCQNDIGGPQGCIAVRYSGCMAQQPGPIWCDMRQAIDWLEHHCPSYAPTTRLTVQHKDVELEQLCQQSDIQHVPHAIVAQLQRHFCTTDTACCL